MVGLSLAPPPTCAMGSQKRAWPQGAGTEASPLLSLCPLACAVVKGVAKPPDTQEFGRGSADPSLYPSWYRLPAGQTAVPPARAGEGAGLGEASALKEGVGQKATDTRGPDTAKKEPSSSTPSTQVSDPALALFREGVSLPQQARRQGNVKVIFVH